MFETNKLIKAAAHGLVWVGQGRTGQGRADVEAFEKAKEGYRRILNLFAAADFPLNLNSTMQSINLYQFQADTLRFLRESIVETIFKQGIGGP